MYGEIMCRWWCSARTSATVAGSRCTLRRFAVLVGSSTSCDSPSGSRRCTTLLSIPGVGLLTYNSLTSLDLPVIMTTVVYAAFFITLASALVDLVYAWLDPRVRLA